MHYNSVQCNAVHYNAVQCNAQQYNAVQCNAQHNNAVQCNAVHYNAVQCNAVHYTAPLTALQDAGHCIAEVGRIISRHRISRKSDHLFLGWTQIVTHATLDPCICKFMNQSELM